MWKNIQKGEDLLCKGLRWQVGNNLDVDLWNGPWIPSLDNFTLQITGDAQLAPMRVANIIENNPRGWNLSPISSFISPLMVNLISQIPLGLSPSSDNLIWHHEKKRLIFG